MCYLFIYLFIHSFIYLFIKDFERVTVSSEDGHEKHCITNVVSMVSHAEMITL